jgi:hypothetical protein
MFTPHSVLMGIDQPATRWGLRGTLVAAGVAVAIAGVGGAAVYAATDQPQFGHHFAPPPGSGPHAGGPGPGGAALAVDDPTGPPLHGEFVVADNKGGYLTVLTQIGSVTEVKTTVTPIILSVRSADGFTQSYQLPPTAQPPAVADQVLLHATRTGTGTPTVTSLSDAQRNGTPQVPAAAG